LIFLYSPQVLVHEGVGDMPIGLYLARWGKEGSVRYSDMDGKVSDLVSREARLASLHSAVYASAMELVGMAMKSRPGVEMCMGFLAQAKEAISCLIVKDAAIPGLSRDKGSTDVHEEGEQEEADVIVAPPKVRSRGRPKEKRLKSFGEAMAGKRKLSASEGVSRVTRSKVTSSAGLSNAANNPPARCRVCYSTEHDVTGCPENEEPLPGPTARKCHLCGEYGHYRSTCGRKSSYSRNN
jgi:hypothetical protein